MVLPPPMQSSLPAGWLAFTGKESNPLDHNKRFHITHPPFLDLSWRYRNELPPSHHPSLSPGSRTPIAVGAPCLAFEAKVSQSFCGAGGRNWPMTSLSQFDPRPLLAE